MSKFSFIPVITAEYVFKYRTCKKKGQTSTLSLYSKEERYIASTEEFLGADNGKRDENGWTMFYVTSIHNDSALHEPAAPIS